MSGQSAPKVTSKNKPAALQKAATPLASDKHASSHLLSRLDALVSSGSSTIRIPGGARLCSAEQMELDLDLDADGNEENEDDEMVGQEDRDLDEGDHGEDSNEGEADEEESQSENALLTPPPTVSKKRKRKHDEVDDIEGKSE